MDFGCILEAKWLPQNNAISIRKTFGIWHDFQEILMETFEQKGMGDVSNSTGNTAPWRNSTPSAANMLWVTALKARGSTNRSGPAVPQTPVLVLVPPGTRVQALASPHSGRFADVSPTLRVPTAPPFRLLAHAGPLGVWQLRCDASEARVVSTPSATSNG